MTIKVEIPIRLRLGSLEALQDPDLDSALEASINRSMARAIETLDRRSAKAGRPSPPLRLEAPHLVTTGLPPDAAIPLLERISDISVRALAVHSPRGTIAAPHPKPTSTGSTARRGAVGAAAPRLSGDWLTIRNTGHLQTAFRAALAKRHERVPRHGYLGAIFRAPDGVPVIYVRRYPGGTQVLSQPIERLAAYRAESRGSVSEVAVELPSKARYRVRVLTKDALGRFFDPAARSLYPRRRGEWAADRAYNDRIKGKATELARQYAAKYPHAGGYLLLSVDGAQFLIAVPGNVEPGLECELIVLDAKSDLPLTSDELAAADKEEAAGLGTRFEPCTDTDAPRFTDEESTQLMYTCEPFCGEPALVLLGNWGEGIRSKIDRLATRLQLAPCDYAGTFLLAAAVAPGMYAERVALGPITEPAKTEAAAGEGNLGTLDMKFVESSEISELRRLAALVPQIDSLKKELFASAVSYKDALGERYPHWGLMFEHLFAERMIASAGKIFAATCNVIFRQLLNASRRAIEARQADWFTKQFTLMILPQLRAIDDLEDLIRRLKQGAQFNPVQSPPAGMTFEAASTWKNSVSDFTSALGPGRATEQQTLYDQPQVFEFDEGLFQSQFLIRDKQGRFWDEKSLDFAINLRRGIAEEQEPLVKQVLDLPEFMADLREASQESDGETAVATALGDLLKDMQAKNQSLSEKAANDYMAGVVASRLTDPRRGEALQGIHQQAERAIADAFAGSHWYTEGRNQVLRTAIGKQQLLGIVEFAGIVVLAVLCAPIVPALAGAALGIYHLVEANQKQRIYRALIDPELVIKYPELEAELLAAEIGAILSFIPLGIEFKGAASAAFRVFDEEGATFAQAAAAGFRTAFVDKAVAQLAETVAKGIAEALLKESLKAAFWGTVIQLALLPLVMSLEEQAKMVGPAGGVEDLRHLGGLESGMEVLIQHERDVWAAQRGKRP